MTPISHLSDLLQVTPECTESSIARERTTDAATPQYSVAVLTHWCELIAYTHEISELAAQAAESNVFYEPAVLLPSLRQFGAGKRFRFVLIYRHAPSSLRELCCFVPLEIRSGYRGLPIRSASLWDYLHLHTCSPLLRRGSEKSAFDWFLRWAQQQQHEFSLLELSYVAADGSLGLAVRECLQRYGHKVTLNYSRAFLRRKNSAEEYLAGTLRGVKRKELRRQLRRLGECGKLEIRDTSADTVEQDVEEFLTLERTGWKGREGTALACSEAGSQFFREMTRNAFLQGQLILLTMRLNGKAIAAKCNLLTGSGGYTFKITFDESFAEYSPGTQLEIECIRRMHQDMRTEWLDSCAAPGHFMAERLWSERKPIHSILVATNTQGRIVLLVLPALRGARRVRNRLKHFIDYLRNERSHG